MSRWDNRAQNQNSASNRYKKRRDEESGFNRFQTSSSAYGAHSKPRERKKEPYQRPPRFSHPLTPSSTSTNEKYTPTNSSVTRSPPTYQSDVPKKETPKFSPSEYVDRRFERKEIPTFTSSKSLDEEFTERGRRDQELSEIEVRGFRNLDRKTCYINSTLQLLMPLRSVFTKTQRCQCVSCRTYHILGDILHGRISIEAFVHQMNEYLVGYNLYQWHPSREFLGKMFGLIKRHQGELLDGLNITGRHFLSSRSGKEFSLSILDVTKNQYIDEEINENQRDVRYLEFPKFMVVGMNSFRQDSIPSPLRLTRKIDGRKDESVEYDFVSAVSGSRGHAICFSKRNRTWYRFDDTSVTKSSMREMIRDVCSRDTVVSLFLLERR